jgi:hypothetical protein
MQSPRFSVVSRRFPLAYNRLDAAHKKMLQRNMSMLIFWAGFEFPIRAAEPRLVIEPSDFARDV